MEFIQELSSLVRVWVDFNDIEEGVTQTLRDEASGPVRLRDKVIAYDEDGNECRATVVSMDETLLTLELNMETFEDGEKINMISAVDFSTHSYRDRDRYRGHIYLNSTITFTFSSPIDRFPAGIDDFNNILVRKFANRLHDLLGEENE